MGGLLNLSQAAEWLSAVLCPASNVREQRVKGVARDQLQNTFLIFGYWYRYWVILSCSHSCIGQTNSPAFSL